LKKIWLIGALLMLFLVIGASDGLASVHTYSEGSNGVMYRSLQTLRDRSNQTWQVVLYKRV
jgi:hypothetical protein